MNEDRLWRLPAARFQEIQGTDSIDIKILERPRGGEIMARLGRGVDQQLRLEVLDQFLDAMTVPDIELAMRKVTARLLQALLIPSCIAGGAEELGAHIVVNAHDTPAPAVEVGHDLRPDEPVRPGDQNCAHKLACERDFLGMGSNYIPRLRLRVRMGPLETEKETETGTGRGICSGFSRF